MMPTISILTAPNSNDIILVIDGDPDQAQPWNIILKPEAAYNLGNDLSMQALRKINNSLARSVQTLSGVSLSSNDNSGSNPSSNRAFKGPQGQGGPGAGEAPQNALNARSGAGKGLPAPPAARASQGPSSSVDSIQNNLGTLFNQQPKLNNSNSSSDPSLLPDEFPS